MIENLFVTWFNNALNNTAFLCANMTFAELFFTFFFLFQPEHYLLLFQLSTSKFIRNFFLVAVDVA